MECSQGQVSTIVFTLLIRQMKRTCKIHEMYLVLGQFELGKYWGVLVRFEESHPHELALDRKLRFLR